MANTKSAIKRIRRISKQTIVNKARKSRYKNALKKMNALIEDKKKDEAIKFLPKLNSELMKIAKSGIIKKQNASRNVSRITKKIALKKMNGLIENKDKKKALAYLPKLNSELMKIAKTGVIKKGNASRNISRITRKISAI